MQENNIIINPWIVGKFLSRNYIEYDINGDKNQALSIEKYLNKIRLYLNDIINDFKKSDTWEIQLTTAINVICSKLL